MAERFISLLKENGTRTAVPAYSLRNIAETEDFAVVTAADGTSFKARISEVTLEGSDGYNPFIERIRTTTPMDTILRQINNG